MAHHRGDKLAARKHGDHQAHAQGCEGNSAAVPRARGAIRAGGTPNKKDSHRGGHRHSTHPHDESRGRACPAGFSVLATGVTMMPSMVPRFPLARYHQRREQRSDQGHDDGDKAGDKIVAAAQRRVEPDPRVGDDGCGQARAFADCLLLPPEHPRAGHIISIRARLIGIHAVDGEMNRSGFQSCTRGA